MSGGKEAASRLCQGSLAVHSGPVCDTWEGELRRLPLVGAGSPIAHCYVGQTSAARPAWAPVERAVRVTRARFTLAMSVLVCALRDPTIPKLNPQSFAAKLEITRGQSGEPISVRLAQPVKFWQVLAQENAARMCGGWSAMEHCVTSVSLCVTVTMQMVTRAGLTLPVSCFASAAAGGTSS